MRPLLRWMICFALMLSLFLPPRLHAMAAGAHEVHGAAVAAIAVHQGDCHDAPSSKNDGAYAACLIACASLPALLALPAALWHAGDSEQLRPYFALLTPVAEPETLLRPPISRS